jgi:hypothetical protein
MNMQEVEEVKQKHLARVSIPSGRAIVIVRCRELPPGAPSRELIVREVRQRPRRHRRIAPRRIAATELQSVIVSSDLAVPARVWGLALQADILADELAEAARASTDPSALALARAESLVSRLRLAIGAPGSLGETEAVA